MRTASIAALLLCSLAPAGAETPQGRWKPPDFGRIASGNSTIAVSYADKPAVLVAYVAAMRSYGAAAEREGVAGLADTLVARDQPPSIPWTWTAANGDSVRRVEEGVFRLSTGDYLGNWFTEVECRMDEWPLFLCSDGKERRMSAPDLSTMIFEGIEYTRPLPEEQLVDDDSGAQGPPGPVESR